MQPSAAASELTSAVTPLPEPAGRRMLLQAGLTAGSLVVMVAEPNASYEAISLVPVTGSTTTSESPFITSWVVSEPTPARSRNVGGPLGSAWAGLVLKASIATSEPPATARNRFLFTAGILFYERRVRTYIRREVREASGFAPTVAAAGCRRHCGQEFPLLVTGL